jgi:hypothetical protein
MTIALSAWYQASWSRVRMEAFFLQSSVSLTGGYESVPKL